jgi:hypothetical protein
MQHLIPCGTTAGLYFVSIVAFVVDLFFRSSTDGVQLHLIFADNRISDNDIMFMTITYDWMENRVSSLSAMHNGFNNIDFSLSLFNHKNI